MSDLVLQQKAGQYWVYKLTKFDDELAQVLAKLNLDTFWSISVSGDEISVISSKFDNINIENSEGPWSLFRVAGTLEFGLTGILASLTLPLADAGVSVFATSTFDTDYLLVKVQKATEAVSAWQQAGFRVEVL
jgi:uncharacterized protein